jgi:hypothetical protein
MTLDTLSPIAPVDKGSTSDVPPPSAGVINPYALAELIAGRKINWKQIAEPKRMLEELLQTPYHELFDPRHNSPLYLGFRRGENRQMVPARPAILDIKPRDLVTDLELNPIFDATRLRVLGDLGSVFKRDDIASILIDQVEVANDGRLRLQVTLPGDERDQRLARLLTPDILKAILDWDLQIIMPWTPPNATWADHGRFFNETAEFFDPIQGALGDCYFIAAMASVAWARPHMIRHLTRATGLNQQQFVNIVRFFNPTDNQWSDVEVTDNIPISTSSLQPLYARSSEDGETWPAIYEKAYAKWRSGTQSDYPAYPPLTGGDPIRACAEITGLTEFAHFTGHYTADELWDIVRGNSMSRRTLNPMVACTYGSDADLPPGVHYADANLVGWHAYSVLGWDYHAGQKYIILRNPWGSTEASAFNLTGTTSFYDISFWRPVVLSNPDGVFGLEANAFRTYFSWLGGAR